MGTALFQCGCFITTSMFGDREITGAGTCREHSDEETRQLWKELVKVYTEMAEIIRRKHPSEDYAKIKRREGMG